MYNYKYYTYLINKGFVLNMCYIHLTENASFNSLYSRNIVNRDINIKEINLYSDPTNAYIPYAILMFSDQTYKNIIAVDLEHTLKYKINNQDQIEIPIKDLPRDFKRNVYNLLFSLLVKIRLNITLPESK